MSKTLSAERVWTSREFQTVGAATQNALDVNGMVAGGCCNSNGIKRCFCLTSVCLMYVCRVHQA